MARVLAAGLAVVFFSVMGAGVGGATSASATSGATGANFIATGHDLDYHCRNEGNPNECAYLKIAVDKVRNGSTLPVLSIDHGSTLTGALASAGVSNVEATNPADAATFNSLAFTSPSGVPLYSAIVVASSYYVTDISESDSATINARAADFKTFFNGGGGILALSSAGMAGYYDFLPIPVTGTSVEAPFAVTTQGAALGITSDMANCCATHNSFATPASPLVTLETDSTGASETIAGFGLAISGGAFAPAPKDTIDGGATAYTNTATPTISGTSTAVSGSAVSVTINGQTLTTTVSSTGTWKVTAATLPEGTYAVVATTTDSTSTKTDSVNQSLTVDTTAPKVTIDGGPTLLINNRTRPITGTTDAAAGTMVKVTVGGQTFMPDVLAGGTWTVTPTSLSDGVYTVTAQIVDLASNIGTATQALTVDATAPVVTIDGGATALTNNPVRTISGTTDAPVGTTVIVYYQTVPLTTKVVSPNVWSVTPVSLSEGSNTVWATVLDPAGNTGSATQTVTLDTIAPVVTFDSGDAALTNNPIAAITGKTDAEAGTPVSVTVDGQTLSTTVASGGTWSVTPAAIDEGEYVVTVTSTDKAGNSTSKSQELTVDTTAPEVSIDGGASAITNNPTAAISGTTDAAMGTTVTVTVGGQTLTTTVTVRGTWTVTPSTLTDASDTVTVSVLDPAGNDGTATQSLLVDTTAPVVSIDGGATALTNNSNAIIAGTTDAPVGSLVTVTVYGEIMTTTVTPVGTWSVTATGLPDGGNTVEVNIADEAGNNGYQYQELTVDTSVPVVGIDGGWVHETNSSTISGTTDNAPGTTVTVTVAGQILTTEVNTDGIWSVTASGLRDGGYFVSASVVNAAGTTGRETQILILDTVAPVVGIDGGAYALINNATPPLSGTTDAAEGTTVTVTVGGQILTTLVTAGGTWAVNPSTLAEGPQDVIATIVDPAGNIGTATQVLTIDTIAPVVTFDLGNTVLTKNPDAEVTGTTDASAGTTVTVTVDGQTLTTTVLPDGTWMVTPGTLDDGEYTVDATVVDPAGNSTTESQDLTVDTTPPVVDIDGGLMHVTNSSTITGTTDAAPGTLVTVSVGGQVLTTTVSSGGTWTVTATGLDDGTYSVDVSITDPAGNTGLVEHGLTLDTVAPVVGIDGGATAVVNGSSPTITGTTDAAPETKVTVTVAGVVLHTFVKADGTWSVSPVGLADGTYAVVASVTDPAGNTGTASQSLVEGPAAVDLDLGFAVGSTLDGSTVTVSGSGLGDKSTLDLQVFSTPQTIGSSVVGSNGTSNYTAVMPANLPAGVHHLLLTGTSSSGVPVTVTKWFTISSSGKVLAVSSTGPTPTLAELAMTGGTVNIGSDVIVGLLAMLLGAGLLMRRSFRRTNSTQSILK